ncbi:MAG: phage integrase N-terminal SAM-like domain-containing protein, partial [Bacteroidota bacterium]
MTPHGNICIRKNIVTLSLSQPKGIDRMNLAFQRNEYLYECVRALFGVACIQSRNFWYIESSKYWPIDLFEAFRRRTWLNCSSLKIAKGEEDRSIHDCEAPFPERSAGSAVHLQNFDSWLPHKRYSASTIKTYTGALQSFLRWLGDKPPEAVGADDVVAYVNM